MQLKTFPKRYLASKSIYGDRRYFRLYVKKRVKSTEIHPYKKQCEFQSISHFFWHKIQDIFSLRGWILKTLLVALFMIKISSQFSWNFIAKFGYKLEISWKLEELKWFLSNNSEVSSYLLGHILLFWKVTMPVMQWQPKIYWINPS